MSNREQIGGLITARIFKVGRLATGKPLGGGLQTGLTVRSTGEQTS